MTESGFDRLARAHADGMTRRQVAKTAAATTIGFYAAGPRRLASALGFGVVATGETCATCREVNGELQCRRCTGPHLPASRQLAAWARKSRSYGALMKYAATLGLGATGPKKLAYLEHRDIASLTQDLAGADGMAARITYVHRQLRHRRTQTALLAVAPTNGVPYAVRCTNGTTLEFVRPVQGGIEITDGSAIARQASIKSFLCGQAVDQACEKSVGDATTGVCQYAADVLLPSVETLPGVIACLLSFLACLKAGKKVGENCRSCLHDYACGCPGGWDLCGTGVCRHCKDTYNDPLNCGECFNTCNPNESCNGGNCTCGTSGDCTFQAPTDTCCPTPSGPACVDVLTDRNNCGACGHACITGAFCCQGKCKECPFGEMPDPQTCQCPPMPQPQQYWCNCNQTCYTDEGTCFANCHPSLKCFVGICYPANPGQCG